MEQWVNWYCDEEDHEAQYLLCDSCAKEFLEAYIEFQTIGGPGDVCDVCERVKNDNR